MFGKNMCVIRDYTKDKCLESDLFDSTSQMGFGEKFGLKSSARSKKEVVQKYNMLRAKNKNKEKYNVGDITEDDVVAENGEWHIKKLYDFDHDDNYNYVYKTIYQPLNKEFQYLNKKGSICYTEERAQRIYNLLKKLTFLLDKYLENNPSSDPFRYAVFQNLVDEVDTRMQQIYLGWERLSERDRENAMYKCSSNYGGKKRKRSVRKRSFTYKQTFKIKTKTKTKQIKKRRNNTRRI
jgi:hypothetical protein